MSSRVSARDCLKDICRHSRSGFTLLEMSVSISIMVMLTILGGTVYSGWADSSARSGGFKVLEAVQVTVRSLSVRSGGVYTPDIISGLNVIGVSLVVGAVAVTQQGEVSVAEDPRGAGSFVYVGAGASGECLILIDNPLAATYYGINQGLSSLVGCSAGVLTGNLLDAIISVDVEHPTRVVI